MSRSNYWRKQRSWKRGTLLLQYPWQNWHASFSRPASIKLWLFGEESRVATTIVVFDCPTLKIYHKFYGIFPLLLVSPITRNSKCLFKGPRCLFESQRLTDYPVLELHLVFQIPCLIPRNRTLHSLLVKLQRVGALVVSSARQIQLLRLQPLDCSDQVPIPQHPRPPIRLATRARPEEVLFLVGEVGEVAAIYLVEGQTSRRVILAGASARHRATIRLVEFLALGRRDNKIIQPRAAPRLRLDLLASLRRANLQNQQRLDQVKHLVRLAVQAVLGPSPSAI